MMMSFLHSQFAPEVLGPETAPILPWMSERNHNDGRSVCKFSEAGQLTFGSCVSGLNVRRGWWTSSVRVCGYVFVNLSPVGGTVSL